MGNVQGVIMVWI